MKYTPLIIIFIMVICAMGLTLKSQSEVNKHEPIETKICEIPSQSDGLKNLLSTFCINGFIFLRIDNGVVIPTNHYTVVQILNKYGNPIECNCDK